MASEICYHAAALMPPTAARPTRFTVIMAYFMIYVVWGSTYFFIGEAAHEFPPFLLGALRFSAAGGCLMALAFARRENIFSLQLVASSALCGLMLLFADMLAIIFALRYITSSLVAVLAASTLIWITLLDVPRWRHYLHHPRILVGVLGGMVGVILLYWGNLLEQGEEASCGVLIFLVGAIFWSLGSLFSKYGASQYEAVNAWSGTAWQMLAAAGAFWLCSLGAGEFAAVEWDSISLRAWISLAYLILFGSLLAYSSYVWLLKTRPATEVGTHAYANPFIAIMLGACLGGESITFSQWAGLAVTLLSLFLVQGHTQN